VIVTLAMLTGVAAADGGLRATGRVRSAEPGPSFAAALGTGYGFTEGVLEMDDAHHRIGGLAALALSATPWLELGGELRGRYDKHTGTMPDDGFIGDPRLWAKLGGSVGGDRYLGLRLGVWLPGADAPSIEPGAISLDAAGLFTIAGGGTSFTATAGFRLDRSSESVDADALSPPDRLGLGISESNAVLLGLGVARGGASQVFGEITMDLLLGDGAPSAMQSPLRVGAGVRRALDASVSLEAMLEVAASQRPAPGDEALVAIEPRVSATVGLSWRPRPAPAARPVVDVVEKAPDPVEPPPPPPPTTGGVRGKILDPDGAPLPGATVRLGVNSATTGEDGTFTLDTIPPGEVELIIERPGHEPLRHKATITAGGEVAVDLTLARVKLPSVIRGVVRNYGGQGLAAKVRVEPLGLEVTANADGSFEIEVPPGKYTVVVSHAGYTTQESKNVEVEDQGVTSRNIELRKAKGR
jgi:hypothetical protein